MSRGTAIRMAVGGNPDGAVDLRNICRSVLLGSTEKFRRWTRDVGSGERGCLNSIS